MVPDPFAVLPAHLQVLQVMRDIFAGRAGAFSRHYCYPYSLPLTAVSHQKPGKRRQLRGDEAREQRASSKRPHQREDRAEQERGQCQLSQFPDISCPQQSARPRVATRDHEPRRQERIRNYRGQSAEQRRVARHMPVKSPKKRGKRCGETRLYQQDLEDGRDGRGSGLLVSLAPHVLLASGNKNATTLG